MHNRAAAARAASLEKILFSNFKISRKKYSLEKQLEINHTAGSICRTLGSGEEKQKPNTRGVSAAIALELRAGAPYGLLVAVLVESIAEGGDNRVGLHFCPFLRALGQTITMLDHYVNYPEKTKIVTEAALSTQ